MQSPIHLLHNFPAVLQACEDTRNAARLKYRTRLKEITPPAYAMSLPASFLPLPAETPVPQGKAILVALPQDFEGSLHALAVAPRAIFLHPDVGLGAQEAYLSLSLRARAPALPVAVWLELRHVVEASLYNEQNAGSADVIVAFVAGNELIVTSIECDAAMKKRCDDALRAANKPPYANEERRTKGADTAARYGERPWLFMRYELRAGISRLAVSWAAFPAQLPECVL